MITFSHYLVLRLDTLYRVVAEIESFRTIIIKLVVIPDYSNLQITLDLKLNRFNCYGEESLVDGSIVP